MQHWIDEAIARALTRLDAIAQEATDFPHITEKQRWCYTADGVWTGGFWAGLLWLAYQRGRQGRHSEQALAFTERLLPRAADARNHDLGFMFFPSAVKAWHLIDDPRYRDAAVQAAQSLAAQFNPQAGFIPGWGYFGGADWSGRVLVDTLMNLPLLVWAVQHGADTGLLEVVRRHAATTLAHHLRRDGSVYHVYRFDPHTGQPLGGDTYQGLEPQSAWTRGQAWAITGLAILARMMSDTRYLAASERIAARFVDRLPPDDVPPWDFDAPGPDEPKDASAGAIASYGLLQLYRLTGRRKQLDNATRLLRALASSCANRGDAGGLLLHATADLPHGLGIDESTMYGDYYYLKSLVALDELLAHA